MGLLLPLVGGRFGGHEDALRGNTRKASSHFVAILPMFFNAEDDEDAEDVLYKSIPVKEINRRYERSTGCGNHNRKIASSPSSASSE